MSREIERRHIVHKVELRKSSSGGPGTLVGYAAKFNTESEDLGGFVETIASGAFTKTLSESVRAMCRYNHHDAFLLGTTEAGTLRMSLDDVGLLYEVDLPDTNAGRDVAALAARGDVRYSSFAFRTIKDEWLYDSDASVQRRILREVELVDVAPVNSPAYLDTAVALRALEQATTTHELRASEPEKAEKAEPTVEPREHSTVPASVLSLQMELTELQ